MLLSFSHRMRLSDKLGLRREGLSYPGKGWLWFSGATSLPNCSPFQMYSYQSPGEKGDSEQKQRELFFLKTSGSPSCISSTFLSPHSSSLGRILAGPAALGFFLPSGFGWFGWLIPTQSQNLDSLGCLDEASTCLLSCSSQVCILWIDYYLHGPPEGLSFSNQNMKVQLVPG